MIEGALAANRFGLGARPQELRAIGGSARDWLARQVLGARPSPPEIASLPSSAALFQRFAQATEARRKQRDAAQADVQNVRAQLVPLYLEQVKARYTVAARTTESFRERLVHFWTNHFAISADKPQVVALAGTLENEVIRPGIAGTFAELLLAVEAHPAMILYLDNQASAGPRSTLASRAARRGRKLDINENLAREILELHTLGVQGGYSQTDVTTFAKVLTGWSVGGGRGALAGGEPGRFVFREMAHEPGAQIILGKRYAEDGLAQGRAVLRDLARHPATVSHIATKLVRHFAGDEPPASAVAHVARAFASSDGHLPTVHRAVLELPVAWQPAPAKFKSPHEYVVATFRALDFVPSEARHVAAPFELLGQRPYGPGSPAGWPDTAAHWDGPDALLKRIEWATQIGSRVGKRIHPGALAEETLGETLTSHTRTAIARAADATQALVLLLASPEFMRR